MASLTQSITFYGTLKYVSEVTRQYESEGFRLSKVEAKIKWPYFWIRIYTVTMTRPVRLCYMVHGNEIDLTDWEFSVRIKSMALESQLQQAIESEDYEEAARLRDLINKK